MSNDSTLTRSRSTEEKLAAARKTLKKYQSRHATKTFSFKPTHATPAAGHAHPSSERSGLSQRVASVPDLSNLVNKPSGTLTASKGFTIGDEWTHVTGPYNPNVFAGKSRTNTEDEDNCKISLFGHSLPVDLLRPVRAISPSPAGHAGEEWTKHETPPGITVEAHDQTIDILVSENSSLRSQITSLQAELTLAKEEERKLKEQLDKGEGDMKATISKERAQLEEVRELEIKTLQSELEKRTSELEDTCQENTELISKVTSQDAQLQSLLKTNTELRSKLAMAELLNQQLSAESPSTLLSESLTGQLDKLRGEVVRLETVVRSVSGERDQALSDLDALRDAMIQRQEEATEKLTEVHSRLMDTETENVFISEQLRDLQERHDLLTQQASTEHAQFQQSAQVAIETLQREKEELQRQLQSQAEGNKILSQSLERLQEVTRERGRESERLRESAVDSHRLLDTMTRDKESLSRAMAQNQQLKTQLVELQEAFVKITQQNMQLATDLETERFRVSQLQSQVQTATLAGGGTDAATQTEREDEEENERGPLPDYSHLTALLKSSEEERDSLQQQLQALCEARDSLQREVLQLQSQVTSHPTQSTSPNDRSQPISDGPAQDTANQTMDLLSGLQANFNALQERYVAVMGEKAELLEQVEQRELTIGQLSGETETIGEYIMLYQRQREALRDKFKEKDKFIRRLISEKDTAQAQLMKAQRLVRQLIDNKTTSHHITTPTSPSPPPPSPPSSLPIHLRPLPSHHQHNHSPPTPPPLPSSDPTPPSDTVEQIYQLLAVMGESGEGVRDATAPCTCCTGDLIVV